ncbi:PKD-like family lipoprotein [Parapedobacter tibetensis]|uniref:PKD-like family lipoprotein n=1 Tax=Parapedobacter tibetensis TaxID=2972951 RepID=UPI00214DD0C1|nr:PKD-like family lipoprotein [Parapedobacter tibetensis]
MRYILSISIVALLFASCYKDKGNYDINMPEIPVVGNLDTLYEAIVGDSLIIEPQVTAAADADIELEWSIGVPEAPAGAYEFLGSSLRIVFGLQANRYTARLTVHNKTNGMRYFHTFVIQGITEFVRGTTVLSVEDGITRFSFIKPDSTVQPRIYEAINGKQLLDEPIHLFYMSDLGTGGMPLGYWLISRHGGVRLNVSTMQEDPLYPNTLATNFFSPPANMTVGSFQQFERGVLMGIVNGKFYGGTTNTWNQAATYGMFGGYADGDYELAPTFVMSTVDNNTSFIAFDRERQQFLRFNLYNGPTYFGTQYSVINPEIFDPLHVGMDLIDMVQINNADTYAYVSGEDGTVYELLFNVNFNGPFTFTPGHERPFVRQELFGENTKLLAARNGVIYIASGSKVYQYNPLNEEVRELNTQFNTPVTMIKFTDGENTLVVGSGTSLYYLAIQTGRFGDLTGQIDDIPGYPVDIAFRN